MKRLLSIGTLAALAAMSASAADPSARASFDAGLRDFASSNYPAASNAFLAAAAAAPAEKLDPAAAYFKDRQGQIVKTVLKEDVLQKLALGTGGTYVRSAPGDTGLERVFNESITHLKRSEQETRTAKNYEERFVWPIAAALLLLAWEALLGDRRKNHAEADA